MRLQVCEYVVWCVATLSAFRLAIFYFFEFCVFFAASIKLTSLLNCCCCSVVFAAITRIMRSHTQTAATCVSCCYFTLAAFVDYAGWLLLLFDKTA